MKVHAVYSGKTFSVLKGEIVEYAIANEDEAPTVDVVMLSQEPSEGAVSFSDPEKGWVYNPAWSVRRSIAVLYGEVRIPLGTMIRKLDKYIVEKTVNADVAEALLARGKKLAEKIQNGDVVTPEDAVVEENGLKFEILRTASIEDTGDLYETLLRAYYVVTAARKRVILASPVFARINAFGKEQWYVLTLPRVWHIIRAEPQLVVQIGVIRGGYNAPYFILKDTITPVDLGTIRRQRDNVAELMNALKMMALGAVPGSEEAPPI